MGKRNNRTGDFVLSGHVAGRDFTWAEAYGKQPVAMISENFAREYWRDPANALGKRIRVSNIDIWSEIVGFVRNV